jgi:hypothetical protein
MLLENGAALQAQPRQVAARRQHSKGFRVVLH